MHTEEMKFVCARCGKKFSRFRCQVKESQSKVYCSMKCYRPAVMVECSFCKKIFRKHPAEVSEKNYCNTECRHNDYIGANNPNYRGGGKEFTCAECGKNFKVSDWMLSEKKHKGIFCSFKCLKKNKADRKISPEQDRIHRAMRRSVCRAIKNKSRVSWVSMLGYDAKQLMEHLETLFLEGMSWGNYGEWQIDHIVPVSAFVFSNKNDEQFRACWDINNLQPLWRIDNIKKGGVKRIGFVE